MPSCSILGKIFHPIATDNEYVNDMLDMKLAIYTPFSFHMSPGIFLTSSDDIETFNYKEQIEISKLFNSKLTDFVLVAHRSTIDIAKDHGCYGLGERIKNDQLSSVYECKFVLQKPSIDTINNSELVQNDGEKYVYTDSVFYFTHAVIHVLLLYSRLYYEQICDLNIEIDAYRDFLQPLGAKPIELQSYLSNLKCLNPSLKRTIFENLYKIMLNKRSLIIALENSIFYHLGTINELLDLYLNDEGENVYFTNFRNSIKYKNVKSSFYVKESGEKEIFNENLKFCAINSVMSVSNINLSSSCLLEYCYFDLKNSPIKLNINSYCYLNSCYLNANELETIDEDMVLNIPSNLCLHTIPVFENENIKYVTVFYSKNDNLKATYPSFDTIKLLNRMVFVDKKMVSCEKFERLISQPQSSDESNKYTFWNLRIFKVEDTMSKSFINAVNLINLYTKSQTYDDALKVFEEILNDKIVKKCVFYSLFDLLSNCDYETMILHRIKYF